MKILIALLLVLVMTLPLCCMPVALADDWDDLDDDDIAALIFLAALDEAMNEYDNEQSSRSSSSSSSSKSKKPNVPASTAPVTYVTPYNANVQTNGGVLNIRNKANKGATILAKLSNGSPLIVKGYTGSWLQVEANGVTGFVPSRYVTGAVQTAVPAYNTSVPATTAQGSYAIVNPSNNFVNMRATPSTDSQVISVYYYGYRLKVLSQMSDWCQVLDEATGRTGYMATRFLLWDNSVAPAAADNG